MGFVHSISKAFGDLGLRAKLGIVIGVLALPVVALVIIQYMDRSDEISLAQSEADGMEYVASVSTLLYDVQRHRMYAAASGAGDVNQRTNLENASAAVDRDFQALKAIDAKHSGWGTSELVAKIGSEWELLKGGRQTGIAEASISAHNRLVDESILPLVFLVGNKAGIYLDPEVATLNTILGTTQELFGFSEAASRAGAYGAVIAANRASGQPTGASLRALLGAQLQIMQSRDESSRRWLEGAMAADLRYETVLRPLVIESQAKMASFADQVDNLASANVLTSTSADVLSQGLASIDGSNALSSAATGLVVKDLDSRIGDARANLASTLVLGVSAFLLAVALAMVIARSILNPINRLVEVADRMSLGELDVEFDVSSKNEVGRLAESLQRMQMSLRGAIERLRARRAA